MSDQLTTRRDPGSSVWRFLRGVRLELKRVEWPTRRVLISSTVVVLVTIAVMTAFVGGLDLLFSGR